MERWTGWGKVWRPALLWAVISALGPRGCLKVTLSWSVLCITVSVTAFSGDLSLAWVTWMNASPLAGHLGGHYPLQISAGFFFFLSSLLVSTEEFVQRTPAWLTCCLSQAHHQSVCRDFPICSTQLLEAALANLLLFRFLRHVSLVSLPCLPTPGKICRLFDQSWNSLSLRWGEKKPCHGTGGGGLQHASVTTHLQCPT